MVSRKERLIDSGKLAVEPKFIRHFLPRLFLLTAVLVGTAISVVIWANIWGNYGTKGLFQFYNDRRGKAEALTQIPKEKLADLWIIGSSTIYPLLPKDVESTFNLKAYSLANFWARTEEHWCWLNFILKDLQKKPKLIILSLDTWSFAPDEKGPPNFPHLRRRLLNTPQLIKHLPEYSEFKHFLSKSQDLLTGQQLLRALRKISKGSKRRSVFDLSSVNVFGDGSGPYAEEKPDSYFATEEINSFYKDILYSNKEHDFKENQEKFDSFGSLDIVSLQEITVFFPAKKFRKKSIDLFTKFVQLTQKEQIDLLVVLMPVHPYFEEVLNKNTNHSENKKKLFQVATEVITKHAPKATLVDASSLRTFRGDPFLFHDRYHMKPSNAKKMLEFIYSQWKNKRENSAQ